MRTAAAALAASVSSMAQLAIQKAVLRHNGPNERIIFDQPWQSVITKQM
jgi:hypothetical protein